MSICYVIRHCDINSYKYQVSVKKVKNCFPLYTKIGTGYMTLPGECVAIYGECVTPPGECTMFDLAEVRYTPVPALICMLVCVNIYFTKGLQQLSNSS